MFDADLLWFSELVRNVAIVVASFVGAFVAFKGLTSWKAERRWDRNERLASNIVQALYGFREALYKFRRENLTEAETKLICRPDKEFDNYFEAAMAGMNPYYQSRLNQVVEAASEVRVAIEQARFFWNDPFPLVYWEIIEEEIEIRRFLLEYYGGEILGAERSKEELEDFARRSEILIVGSTEYWRREALFDQRVSAVQQHLRAQVRSNK